MCFNFILLGIFIIYIHFFVFFHFIFIIFFISFKIYFFRFNFFLFLLIYYNYYYSLWLMYLSEVVGGEGVINDGLSVLRVAQGIPTIVYHQHPHHQDLICQLVNPKSPDLSTLDHQWLIVNCGLSRVECQQWTIKIWTVNNWPSISGLPASWWLTWILRIKC